MTPSADLFRLIRSLSKSEKRYFKSHSFSSSASGPTDKRNVYHLLFEAILKQKIYDEEKLREQFKGHAFLKNLSVAKNYLYVKILDSLESFHREKSTHYIVRRYMTHAEILEKRGLPDQAVKITRRTKEIAKKFEFYHLLLELYAYKEINVLVAEEDRNALEKIYREVTNVATLSKESIICNHTAARMLNISSGYYRSRDTEMLKEGTRLIRNPDFRKATKAGAFNAASKACLAEFYYWYMMGNYDKARKYAEKNIALCDANSERIKKSIIIYLQHLHNLIAICYEQKKYSDVPGFLEKLRSVSPYLISLNHRAQSYFIFHNAQLQCLYKTGKTAELEKKLPAAIKEFGKHRGSLSNPMKIELLSTFAVSWFYLGDTKKCIQFLNIVRNEYNLDEHPEMQFFFKLFYLIAHYEAGNTEILPYLTQSYYRFLRKAARMTRLEKVIAEFLRKQTKADSEEKLRKEFISFKKKLEETPGEMVDNYIDKFFDLPDWVESKIEKRSFYEIIRKKTERS